MNQTRLNNLYQSTTRILNNQKTSLLHSFLLILLSLNPKFCVIPFCRAVYFTTVLTSGLNCALVFWVSL
jgi:hypothetical protein